MAQGHISTIRHIPRYSSAEAEAHINHSSRKRVNSTVLGE